ncbi:tetratricopeptide repeat protein [Streptomyces sp. NPDC127166]|uniref:tetratricopeptide repeat protein n=1 Tax=Streptomyces sp. NPDC127166 TaxID=3345380 RepID=UPI00363F1C40
MAGRLVLSSAHVVGRTAVRVEVFQPGGVHTWGGTVVWCGTPGGRDDAALVLLDDDPHWQTPTGAARWGRLVTERSGTGCETWGLPDVAQQSGAAVEAVQLQGRMNPGSGFVGNRHVMDLLQHAPQWWQDGTSPWGGLSGAAVFCDRLLVGVVASDRAHSGHGQLNVVPAYVLHHNPGFRAALAEHGAGEAGLEAVEFQHLAEPAAAPARRAGLSSPTALLQVGRQTVPFHGRVELLEQLHRWCALDGFGAWLLHGPGGQGKTRLAHHLAGLLAADGWAVLWPGAGVDDVRLREVRDAAKPLLVVLDYAENRTTQLTALVEAAADHPGTTPLKVLLLARTASDWWAQARTASSLVEEYLDHTPSVPLDPLEDDPDQRPGAYRTAARALAAALPSVQGLTGHDWHTAADTLPVPRLDSDGYANVLTLHMAALADLLDTAAATDLTGAGGELTEGVEDRLLGHERRYWKQSAAAHGLTPHLSLGTLEAALAAAHLVGAADPDQADRTLRRLPALADQTRDRRDAITAWIASLYPATGSDLPWGVLQPDRLAERHVGRVLDNDPALAERLLDGADDAQTTQLLTVYSRAAAHPVFRGRLDAYLTGLCTGHQGIAAQIVTTAVQIDNPAPLINALDTITTDPNTPLDTLTALFRAMPRLTQRLAHSAVQLSQAITSCYRKLAEADPDAYLPYLAYFTNHLSVRLGDVGRREEALVAIEEAVRISRSLAEANPNVHLFDLAISLANLSMQLGEVGRHEEALPVGQDAVVYYRRLAAVDADSYLHWLARSLDTLSARYADVGRREEALAAIEEAVRIRRSLAEANPDAHLPYLAASLSLLSSRLAEVGRCEEGLAAIEEAVRIDRSLVEANPDGHLPHLAKALNNLSNRLAEVGLAEESLTVLQESTAYFRTLADADPEDHVPHLAKTLNNLASRLGEVGRREEGLAAIQEAVRIRRSLAEANPERFKGHLRESLNVAAWLESLPQ